VEGHEEVPGAEEAVTCRSGCFAGGSVVEAGGGVVAHERQLQEAVLLFQAAEREIPALPFSSVFFPLLRLRFLFFLFLFMCVFFNSLSSSCFGIVPLPYLSQSLSFISHSPSPLFPASPFSFSFFSFGPFPFRYFLSLLSVPSFVLSLPHACWRWVVFIGQRERGRPYCRPIAAHGEQGFVALPRRRVGWPVGVAGRARLPRSLIMRVRGASGLAEHAGREMGMKN